MELRVGKRVDADANGMRMLAVLAACFLAGGFLGGVQSVFWDGPDVGAAASYLNDFLLLIKKGSVFGAIIPSFLRRFGDCILVAVLAFGVFGVIGLPVLFLVRGFFLSSAVCCLFRIFGSDGFFLALALFVLPAIFYLPAMFLAGIGGFCFGQRIRLSDTRFCVYIKRLVMALVLVFFCVLFECVLLPRVLYLFEM